MPGLEREVPNQVPMSDRGWLLRSHVAEVFITWFASLNRGSFNVICLFQHGFLTFSSRFGFNVICLIQHGFLAALLHLIVGPS